MTLPVFHFVAAGLVGGYPLSQSADAGLLRERIRSGLPYSALESLTTQLQLSRDELSHILSVPPRTLTRRKQEDRLNLVESDRLLRLAHVAARAVDVLGDVSKASQWLKFPNRALGGETPLSLLDTEIGSRQVEAVLGRIEHGVYS